MSRREEDWEELRNITFIIYGLYGAAVLTFGITLLVGGVLAVVKRDEMRNSPYGEHMDYLLRTLIGAVAGFVLTLIISAVLSKLLYAFAFLAWGVALVVGAWFVMRVGLGCYYLWQEKPVSPHSWLLP